MAERQEVIDPKLERCGNESELPAHHFQPTMAWGYNCKMNYNIIINTPHKPHIYNYKFNSLCSIILLLT